MAEEKKQIHVEVRDKIATLKSMNFQFVGGNSDYEVVFDFDEDWTNYPVKTALFVYGTDTKKVVFDGNVCKGVAVENATICFIGVFADDIATTTPACVSGIRQSIRDIATDLTEAPEEDVYNQIMELLNRYIEQGGGGSGEAGFSPIVKVEAIEGGHRVTITDKKGDHSFDIMDGKDGSDYAITDEDIDELSKKVQRVLYRHDILVSDDWHEGATIYITLINSDPTDYSVQETGEGDEIEMPLLLAQLPKNTEITANGVVFTDGAERWHNVVAVSAYGASLTARYFDRDDGVQSDITIIPTSVKDTVTAIPLSDLPNLDLEVF